MIEIRTGSDSDIPKIKAAYDFLESIDISYSPRILSAHRTPQIMAKEAQVLSKNGFFVSIAAAGGSAHLPGMTASETLLPVVGIPVKTSNLDGLDSLYSIIQMPNGIPVGTVGIGQAEDAAILAAQIAYNNDRDVRNKIRKYRGLKELPDGIRTVALAGIIGPDSIGVDEEKYRDMISMMEELGIKIKEFDVSVDDTDKLKNILTELENAGAMSIIAIADKDTAALSRLAAKHTDLPAIGLPIADGPTGKKGDIFESLLIRTEDTTCPVAGMGINRYTNAALFVCQIAGLFVPEIQAKVKAYRDDLASAVRQKDDRLQRKGVRAFTIS